MLIDRLRDLANLIATIGFDLENREDIEFGLVAIGLNPKDCQKIALHISKIPL